MKSLEFRNDNELFEYICNNLYTAVISDVLDSLGLYGYVMNERIRAIDTEIVLVGRARTMLWVDNFEEKENPYDLELKAMDALCPGDISVHYTGNSHMNAPWGELMSTAAIMRGARGAIIDGFVRDVKKIKEMKFPVFCAGFKPLDSKGRGIVVEYDVPIRCGDVLVNKGDLIVGDVDGVVVIPKAEEKTVIMKAKEKVEKENHSRNDLLKGLLLQEVYDKYKVL